MSPWPFRTALAASLHLLSAMLISMAPVAAQKVAILTPDNAASSRTFAAKLEDALKARVKLIDDSVGETAFGAVDPENAFNLTTQMSQRIGSSIGCDNFILLKAISQRRTSSDRPEYYEASAAIYVVSSRTGRLIFWRLQKFESNSPKDSTNQLAASAARLGAEIEVKMREARADELSKQPPMDIEEVPESSSSAAKEFRAPIPFRRIKPDYTADAALYGVEATVDIVLDLDSAGSITRTEIVRWAGYGLDESVEKAVRAMNWRPAERNGKTLPMRFLVRYNFKKLDKA